MKAPETCPECGSREVKLTQRRVIPEGLIDVAICSVCDWASDRRVGRPPADRSKNHGLRQRVASANDPRSTPPAMP
jgi:protein-arginine kinase activator protein McsA